ncbi:synaptobrevin, WD40/YVTN repeat-like-containing domain protein, partial [Tanacetum coccineum]
VLIAYESGLIILWDLLEGQVAVVRGDKVLELKDGVVDSPSQDGRLSDGQNLEDKEITILCWALSNGTVVAVGYLDGDIMMQLSSAERKLPVIVLHWSPNSKSQNDYDVQLFVYGGDEIGSEEVAVLDMNAFSVSFLTDSLPNPGSLVISMTWKSFVYNGGDVKSPKGARPKDLDKPVDKLMFVCTKDATLYVYDGYDYRTLNYKPVQLKKDTTAISIVVSWIISGPENSTSVPTALCIDCLDVKRLSRFEMMDIGTPCRETISFIYNLVRVSILSVSLVGIKCVDLVRRSTMTQIVSCLLDVLGSLVMKSIVILSHFH